MVPTRLSQVATRACCGCALRFHIITLFYHFRIFITWKIIWFFTGTIPNKRSTRSRISSLKATWRSTVTTNLCGIFVKLWPWEFLGSKLQERTNGSSFTRLPSCKLKLADLCREVMEPQQGTGRDEVEFFLLKKVGDRISPGPEVWGWSTKKYSCNWL